MRSVLPSSALVLVFLCRCGGDDRASVLREGPAPAASVTNSTDSGAGAAIDDGGSTLGDVVSTGSAVSAAPLAPTEAPMPAAVASTNEGPMTPDGSSSVGPPTSSSGGGPPLPEFASGGAPAGGRDASGEEPFIGGPGGAPAPSSPAGNSPGDDVECADDEVTPLDWGACFWSASVPGDSSAEGSFSGTVTEVRSDREESCFAREDASIVAGGTDCDTLNYGCRGAPSEGVTSVTVSDGDSAVEVAWYLGDGGIVNVGDPLEVRYLSDKFTSLGGYNYRQLSILAAGSPAFHVVQGPLSSARFEELFGIEVRYGDSLCRFFGGACYSLLTDVVFSSADESTSLGIGETGVVAGFEITFLAGSQIFDGECDGTSHHSIALVPVPDLR